MMGPDGGWGWMVCASSFVVVFLMDGTAFAFGVLVIEFSSYFNVSISKASWVGSAFYGMPMFIGPVVGFFIRRYSCRYVAIIGGLLATIALAASVFAPNIECLILTAGILTGTLSGFIWVTALVIVGYYFDRRRAIATGIAMSGTGIGIFIYPILTEKLIETYDWKGAILILSGFLLNSVVCGAIFRPLDAEHVSKKCLKYSNEKKYDKIEKGVLKQDFSNLSVLENGADVKCASEPTLSDKNCKPQRCHTDRLRERVITNSDSLNLDTNGNTKTRPFFSHTDLRSKSVNASHISLHSLTVSMFYLENLYVVPKSTSPSEAGDDDIKTVSLKSQLCSMFDPKMFKDYRFVLLLLACLFWSVQTVPAIYLPSLAIANGIPRSTAPLFMSVVGIMNIIGRLSSGVLTDILHIHSIKSFACALIGAAIAMAAIPWCRNAILFAVCCGVYGCCMGCYISLRVVVLADILGIEMLAQSLGVILMIQGAGCVVFPPFAGTGWILESHDSYIIPFSVVAGVYILSAIMCLPVIILSQCKASKPDTDESNEPLQSITSREIIVSEEVS